MMEVKHNPRYENPGLGYPAVELQSHPIGPNLSDESFGISDPARRPLTMRISLFSSIGAIFALCTVMVSGQTLNVKIIQRQNSETGYTYQVPGHMRSMSDGNANCDANSYGYSTDVNCHGSGTTNTTITAPRSEERRTVERKPLEFRRVLFRSMRSMSDGNANCDANSYGYSTDVNCHGSGTTNTTITAPQTISYSVTGATYSLLLPDGRIAVVNCASKSPSFMTGFRSEEH